jgi:hypothetical protein
MRTQRLLAMLLMLALAMSAAPMSRAAHDGT